MTINFYLTQSFALINRGRLDLNHLVVWVDSDVLNLHIYKRNTLTREAGRLFFLTSCETQDSNADILSLILFYFEIF